jgi:hypothetical protein
MKFLWTSPDGVYGILQVKDIPNGVKRSSGFGTPTSLLAKTPDQRLWKRQHWNGKGANGGFYSYVKVADVLGISDIVAPNPAYDMKVLEGWTNALTGMGPAKEAPRRDRCPAVPTYDGLTAEQCYQIFTHNMTAEASPRDQKYLSPVQKQAAREVWSALLKSRVQVTDEKERNRVRVDLEFEEWE